MMIEDIRKHVRMTPFVPFAIIGANGREYRVPTTQHVYLPPVNRAVVIADDEGYAMVMREAQINRLLLPPDRT